MHTFNTAFKLNAAPAVILPGGPTVSYAQLAAMVAHLQTMFAAGPIAGQSSVAMALPNGLEFTAAFLAVVANGMIASPLNPAYTKAEFDFYLQDLNTRVILVPQGTFAANGPIVQAAKDHGAYVVEVAYRGDRVEYVVFGKAGEVARSGGAAPLSVATRPAASVAQLAGTSRPDDIALILHTSGTTGRPKAVPLTHRNLLQSMDNIAQTYSLTPRDRSYVVMPLFHVHGLIGALLSTLYTNGAAIIPPKFSAKAFWGDFAAGDATWYSAVPTIHTILLNTPPPAKTKIRFIRSCSAALAPVTLARLEEKFGVPVLEAYAMTEAAHQMCLNPLAAQGPHKAGTVGLAQGAIEVVILSAEGDQVLGRGEVGEIAIRGENVTRGYLNNPAANAEAFSQQGYFRTGDQGKFDSEGYLTITGRIKELINRGGEKISPIELDGLMLAHPAVGEAVSFGVEDAKYGQVVQAAVVLKKGASLSEKEFQAYLRKKVAAFKVPERIYFVEALPKTATGKIQRRIIAQAFVAKPKL
ncbi:hypothetical protein BABINDRAFT_37791 [Babjeviella inositovora NRRL Y-12698]|uniref:Peroxisomal-coenzyme A synthetase n=1 Tax=Babjeviella inositovora NRRL Y-12698 TaxID=984486 RepID=A0A1E3QNR9_9ASCO|nr:uncharacterized protein BABINDRAFT_37791 [Babjeviella inositovora NRRL Y-12698]ODQ79290.1 hypothetical protein BABINDRAFT_37791 [Babjeviella inositovora NRRL Y-12698]